ncbi:hypothetical protein RchiOBHm_Chr5g0012741 [Rosa chinensis]|uniref:Uncharacterized protein n=1 Tax=Rosa chinensis TaxID=74649 RepID=A0A2P6Q587_ROSCH|nr:hypothetical protein RchiOBHm_Chr5g0012741 [Rosa chinensis]
MYCLVFFTSLGPTLGSAAQAINVSVNMIFTFAIAQVFIAMLCHMKLIWIVLLLLLFLLVRDDLLHLQVPAGDQSSSHRRDGKGVGAAPFLAQVCGSRERHSHGQGGTDCVT